MQFEATVLAQKGSTVKCRVYDPSANRWWDSAAWTNVEALAALTVLTAQPLADPYQDRYTGLVTVPDGTGLIVEYLDASTSVVIAEDSVVMSVDVVASSGTIPFSGGSTAAEMFNTVLPRLGEGGLKVPFLPAVQTVLDVIARRLWFKRSDLAKANMGPSDLSAGVNTITMPADFMGFDGTPFIVKDTGDVDLTQLPPAGRGKYKLPGTPRYYQVLGPNLYLFPTPDSAVSVGAVYYQNAPRLTGMDSVIPYGGIFDLIIADAVVMIGEGGVAATGTAPFQYLINQYVDAVCRDRNPKNIGFFQVPSGNQRSPYSY